MPVRHSPQFKEQVIQFSLAHPEQSLVQISKLKLPPFHGHTIVTNEGVRHAQIQSCVQRSISPADC